MPTRPPRLYDAQFMADAARAHAGLQAQALQVAPHAFGPMSRIPVNVPMADEPELLSAHCFTCGGKSEFEAMPEPKTMKNGALHHMGPCKKCGQTLSAFVSGVKDAA